MMIRTAFKAVCLAVAALCWLEARADTILVEAEQFRDPGGWVNDSQFMDQMGSPFLLAHGVGEPVEDASTTITVPAGEYRVWVRTRDWVATWNAPGAPGRFQVLINGKPLDTTFGTEGAEWHWQEGGTFEVVSPQELTLALHDLTGFEGRCDAIALTTDLQWAPPNGNPEMAQWRRRLLGQPDSPRDGGKFDLVVVGGGIAGTCAALSAARLGLDVALVQDRPVLGGNNSSEVRVWLQGARNREPYPRIGDVVAELEQARRAHYGPTNTADLYEDEKKLALVRAEEKIMLWLNRRVNGVEMDQGTIKAVVAEDTISGDRVCLAGQWFADCTGDGALGFLAGADHEMSLEGHMGPCNLWNVMDTRQPAPFPRCPWALDLSEKPFPGRAMEIGGVAADKRGIEALGGWYWESGFDHDPIARAEYIRDWNFRAMYGAWDALKNVDHRYGTFRLNWSAYVCGKRESRRLMGDVVLSKDDVLGGKVYEDGCVPTGWPIDLHLPDPRYEKGFEGDAFISVAHYNHFPHTYWIPYRCLYSRDVPNLFMAGRDISVTHEALGTSRVMRTGGCMGEVVGMAASLCKRHQTSPRGVYERYLAELQTLMRQGVGRTPAASQVLNPPVWLKEAGENIARRADVTVSGTRDTAAQPVLLVHDGRADLTDNSGRWISDERAEHWIEFRWNRPQGIGAARILSGYRNADGSHTAPIASFHWERFDGTGWQTIPQTAVQENDALDVHFRFPTVTADRIRLVITRTHVNVCRIWEVELYGPTPRP